MNATQKEQIANLLSIRAEITGKSISINALVQMVEDMADLDFTQVMSTLTAWGRTEKGFPFPSDIRAKVMPEIDSKDIAVEVANLIITCVSKYGYTNPDQARARMGELAWETVQQATGWKHICETLTLENEGMTRAQLRGLAEVVSKKAIRGELDQVPQLPQANNAVLKLINTTFKDVDL